MHQAVPVLAAATATQFAAGLGFWFFGVLAPELAAETGLDERDFGLAVSFVFAGTFLSSPFTGMLVRTYGGAGAMVRAFCAMAGALLLTLTATWSGAMLAAFLFGLGYGPQGPVGMTMVTQAADPRHRGLFLALRHSAVPLAAAMTGRVVPPFMVWAGWQAGVLSVFAVCLCALGFALIANRVFEIQATPPRPGGPWRRLADTFRVPKPLAFLWGVGLGFAVTQTAVSFFSYLYLLEVVGLSAVAAGIFSSNLHLTALFGRPLLGWVTDRVGNARIVLAGIAVVTVAAVTGLMQFDSETNVAWLVPLAIACGVSGQCWNSVFVTAMSFHVAPGDLAELNGRAFAFLSLGWMGAAPLMWGLIEVSGGYWLPLTAIAVMNALMAVVLLAAARR